jgi:hypothetical protein
VTTVTTTGAAIYARVSTSDQTCENQLLELRRYCEARGWQMAEYVDTGVSGAKDRRPALDGLLKDARRRRFDVLVCWRLDRLERHLRHLVTMLEDLHSVGVAFVSLGEGIDCTTPAGKLQLISWQPWRSSSGNGFGNAFMLASPGRDGKASGSGGDHTVCQGDRRPRSVLQRARAARKGVVRQGSFAPDSLQTPAAITPVR